MKLLHNLTFKRKLMVLTLVTTTFALLLAGVVLVAYEISTFRESMVNDVSAQAKILANLSTAALSFKDPPAATEMLNELRQEPYIEAAALFDAEGKLFATYQRDPKHPRGIPASVPAQEGHDFTADHLNLRRAVELNGQPIGAVFIVSNMQELSARLWQYTGTVLGVLFVAVLLALWFASVLQRAISQPIVELSDTARIIAENKDFSLRAAKFGNDEIGVFTDAFNQMLAQIQAQDRALQASEERFRSLFENAPVGIYRTTPEGQVLLANPALLRMLGFASSAELAARDLNTEGFVVEGARRDFVQRLEREGELKAYESTWRRKDGTSILVSEYARVVRAPNGQAVYYEGTVEDVTERKRNEIRKTAFSKLGQTLSAATDAKAAARVIVEVADSLLGWDACSLDLYAAEEDRAYALVNMDVMEGQRLDVAPAYPAGPPTPRARRILTQGAELILREPPYTAEPESARFGDQGRPSASLMYVPVRDGTKVTGVLSIQSYRPRAYGPADLETLQALADLCGGALERIRMEENLRHSQQKFEALVNSISGIVWERSPDTFQFTFVSRQSEQILGYPPARWLENACFWRERIHPEDVLEVIQASQAAVATRQPYQFEYRMIAAEGRVVWIRESGTVLLENGQPAAVRGIFVDITARKLAEEQLRDSEALYQSLVENLPQNILRKDLRGRITFANQQFCRTLGKNLHEILGRTSADFYPPELARKYDEDDRRLLESGQLLETVEENQTADGKRMYVQVIKIPLYDAQGRIAGQQCIFWDVTERKQAEDALRESESKFRGLVETSPVGVLIHEGNQFRYVNAVFQTMTGYTQEQLLAMNYWEVIHPEFRELVRGRGRARQQGEEPPGHYEFKSLTKSGDERWVEMRATRIEFEGRPSVLATVSDITERKRAEEQLELLHRQLQDASRRAGMAEVATGVLHNVGNVLNSINVSCTLAIDRIGQSRVANLPKLAALLQPQEGRLAEFLTQDPKGRQIPGYLNALAPVLIEEQTSVLQELRSLRDRIDHIKEIVAMQQSYASTSGVTETLPVQQLVEDALKLNAGALARHGVAVQRQFEPVPMIPTDKHKVLQILLNLIRNAKYACDEGGREPKVITVRIFSAGPDRITVQVRDNGVGIPAENLTKIFQHGFTTRKGGHGFGLHSAALAAQELDGSLTAHSEGPGQGATFTLELPLRRPDPASQSGAAPGAPVPPLSS